MTNFKDAPKDCKTQEVDVLVVDGVFIPCRSCYYYNICAVPLGRHSPNINKPVTNYGDSDIRLMSWEGRAKARSRIYYHCMDFTTKPESK